MKWRKFSWWFCVVKQDQYVPKTIHQCKTRFAVRSVILTWKTCLPCNLQHLVLQDRILVGRITTVKKKKACTGGPGTDNCQHTCQVLIQGTFMCNEYEEQWVLNDNWNNIWSVVLCLWNHIQNHRVKSLLNLWMGHSCCKNSQMCLINPLNLITQVLLPILPWCNHDLEGQTFFFLCVPCCLMYYNLD